MASEKIPLIEVQDVHKVYGGAAGANPTTILDGINLCVHEGEYVSLLGRSGSGKSTLLRILAGLIEASSGKVLASGQPLRGPNPDVAMVFQSFALLPWLTVLENVVLGLQARGMTKANAQQEALKAIDSVGLDGFESAYPKELSGGMKQRVGFARAFVVRPKILFMDEPFSALDVLTAENLRSEIEDLWVSGDFYAKSVLMVTHNIEEAVMLADRIVILGSQPGRIRGEIVVPLSRPRDRKSEGFRKLTEAIYGIMTNPAADVQEAIHRVPSNPAIAFTRLPHVRAGGMSGIVQILAEKGGTVNVSTLAQSLHLSLDDIAGIVEGIVLLKFADLVEGRVVLTDIGYNFANAEIQDSKHIFQAQILAYIPLIRVVLETLKNKRDRSMNVDFFIDILDEHYSAEEAEKQFLTTVDWARFAELFEYDSQRRILFVSEADAIEG